MGRTGSADLPLHGGRVPEWLASRMARLGSVLVEALVLEEGPHGVLRRLAHPFWFQALGGVMGMDWHLSGITTSVLGALKRGLLGREEELGLTVCGGRGRHSRKTPGELIVLGDRTGLDGASLARTSRLVAKVDSAAVQDGFSLYLHGFVVARDGSWAVVQQGMKPQARTARRYHWLSETVRSFVEEPHAAVAEIVHGAPCRFTDPARFSLAHGGKDGHPFPVPLRVYDQTIAVLKRAVAQARLGRDEKLQALRRLDEQARRIEGAVSGPSLEALIEHERDESHRYDGRDVTGAARPVKRGQLALL